MKSLKSVKAEVEYDNGRIFVRNTDGTRSVEVERGKVAVIL